MGLVYVTILSIVPVLAISFSVLKGFGFHKELEPLLYNFLAPLGDRGVELTNQVIGFVENVKGDVLAGVGLVLLFVTTISMAQKVEDSFNFIWRVERSRNLAQRLSEYLSVILVGPVVMVTALALIGSVGNLELVQDVAGIRPVSETLVLIGKLVPYGLVVLGFGFAYWFLPNTRVKLSSALVGGLTGGILWATGSLLFTTFVANSARTLNIYATFAIVIVALLWLYFCWLVLLTGAQVAFYHQHPEYLRIGYRPVYLGSRHRDYIALSVMGILAKSFRDETSHPALEDIARQLNLSSVAILPTVERLEEADLLVRTDDNELMPRRDPQQIRVVDVFAAIREPQESDIFPEGDWPDGVRHAGQRFDDALAETFGDASLYDLVDDQAALPVSRDAGLSAAG